MSPEAPGEAPAGPVWPTSTAARHGSPPRPRTTTGRNMSKQGSARRAPCPGPPSRGKVRPPGDDPTEAPSHARNSFRNRRWPTVLAQGCARAFVGSAFLWGSIPHDEPEIGSQRGCQNEETPFPSGRMGSWTGTQGLTLRVRSREARFGCRPGPLTRRTGHEASPPPREGTRPTDGPTAVSRMNRSAGHGGRLRRFLGCKRMRA